MVSAFLTNRTQPGQRAETFPPRSNSTQLVEEAAFVGDSIGPIGPTSIVLDAIGAWKQPQAKRIEADRSTWRQGLSRRRHEGRRYQPAVGTKVRQCMHPIGDAYTLHSTATIRYRKKQKSIISGGEKKPVCARFPQCPTLQSLSPTVSSSSRPRARPHNDQYKAHWKQLHTVTRCLFATSGRQRTSEDRSLFATRRLRNQDTNRPCGHWLPFLKANCTHTDGRMGDMFEQSCSSLQWRRCEKR